MSPERVGEIVGCCRATAAAVAWALAAATAVAVPVTLHAAPVTIAFSGAVTSDPYGLSMVGAPISGSYTFDTAAPDAVPGSSIGSYRSTGLAYGFDALVDGTFYSTPGAVTVNVANNIGSDQYGVIGSFGDLTLELFLEDFSQTALADDALPAGAPLLAAFGVRSFRLFGSDAEFLGSVDRLACTAGCSAAGLPEPGTLLLVALAGLLWCGGRGRGTTLAVQR